MRIALVIAGAALAGLTGASALWAPSAATPTVSCDRIILRVGNRRQTVRFGIGKRCG